RGAGRSRIVQDEGGVQAERAAHDTAAGGAPGALQRLLARCTDQLLPATWRQQGRLGQHRYRWVDGLPDADKGELPLSRFDPRCASRSGPCSLLRLRAARGDEGDSGVAVVLLQEPDDGTGVAT